jgi:hypothetical protein
MQPEPRLRRVSGTIYLGCTVVTQAGGDGPKSQAKQAEVQPSPSAAPPPGWVRGGILDPRPPCPHLRPSLCAPRALPALRTLPTYRPLRILCTPSCRILYTRGRRCCQPSAAIQPPHPRAQAPHHSSLSRIWHCPLASFSAHALSLRVSCGDERTGGVLLPNTRPQKPQPPRSS